MSVIIAMTRPMAVDIRASLIPDMTSAEFLSVSPSVIAENDLMRPSTVPSSPSSGDIVMIVVSNVSYFCNSKVMRWMATLADRSNCSDVSGNPEILDSTIFTIGL